MELVLKQVRERCGYTQKQLADELGVKVATYRTWEQGSVKLTLENAFNIANVLGCTPNDLCDWYATHPRERPRAQDPAHEELARCYDRCTPERRERILMDVREKALLSQEYSERAADAAQGA
ncbi:helix-turn-helix transcriptional regulator [Parolsenella catena]|uniref:helix-turn-helix transcriptional regulator n=1 Tax=Parolsenella catena TaxID=2003188 RepID=UPI003A907CD6